MGGGREGERGERGKRARAEADQQNRLANINGIFSEANKQTQFELASFQYCFLLLFFLYTERRRIGTGIEQ